MKNLIILDKNDLRELLHEMVKGVTSTANKETDKPYLSLDEGLEYLNDRGVKISKSTLYKHTMEGTIPFKRFGMRKIVFDPEQLEKWAEDRIK